MGDLKWCCFPSAMASAAVRLGVPSPDSLLIAEPEIASYAPRPEFDIAACDSASSDAAFF
jgi:hypothetical protein